MTDETTRVRTLVIGCGNLLRGDDAVGPILVRRMIDLGLPEGVQCLDGGTDGIGAVLQMRGVPEVIFVDACRTGSPPGSLLEVSREEVERLPPAESIDAHACRWHHAIAFGRRLLGEGFPPRVAAYLVEGAAFEPGVGLSVAVDGAVDRLASLLVSRCSVVA